METLKKQVTETKKKKKKQWSYDLNQLNLKNDKNKREKNLSLTIIIRLYYICFFFSIRYIFRAIFFYFLKTHLHHRGFFWTNKNNLACLVVRNHKSISYTKTNTIFMTGTLSLACVSFLVLFSSIWINNYYG